MSSKTDYAPVLNVPLSDALFTVDTRDGLAVSNGFIIATAQNNPYEINIQKKQQLFSGAVQRIALTEINMPWNIPNVNWYNNALFLECDTPSGQDPINIIYSAQYFLPGELATMVQNSLNGVSAPGDYKYYNTNLGIGTTSAEISPAPVFGVSTWTVVWNARRNIFVINPNTANPGDLLWRVNPKIGEYKGRTLFPADNIYVARNSTMAEMMGMNNMATGFTNILRGAYASMLYTTYVDIVSSILCKNQEVRDTSTSYFTGNNIIARVYISNQNMESIDSTGSNILGTRPFMLNFKFNIPKEIQWNPEEFLSSCNIRLQDDKGSLLYSQSVVPNIITSDNGAVPPVITSITEFVGNSGFVQLTFLISEGGKISGKFTAFGQGGNVF